VTAQNPPYPHVTESVVHRKVTPMQHNPEDFLHELDVPRFDLVDWTPRQLARRYRVLTWFFPVGHPRRLRALRRLESQAHRRADG
jgi:hypothetical protein